MLIWGIVWGVILGWLWPGHGGEQLFVGGFLGFLAGLTLRMVVRAEIESRSLTARALTELVSARATAAETDATDIAKLASTRANEAPAARLQTTPHSGTPVPSEPVPEPSSLTPLPQPVVDAPIQESTAPIYVSKPAAASSRVPPQVPPTPNPVDQLFEAIRLWFVGGNTIVRVGLVILFIGLSFLARYAAAAGLFPVEFRLTAIGAAAIALLVFGFIKRHERPAFALSLQGAGVAVMYLTAFAAFRMYGLLPPLLAFALMLLVCALSCALALLQDSRTLAVAAFSGGFAVPILLSTGQGSHVGLFSYYTVLNLAILFIAYRRSWRVLNVVGFIATFGVASLWGGLKYVPEQYASTQPFLLGFVLIYLGTAILYSRNTPTRLGNSVDSMLVFGTPLIGFGLQAGLVHGMEFGTAFSALGFAALYLASATLLVRLSLDNYRLLIECFLALGVGFATLAVPLALDVRWTSAVWALEGLGAFWVGVRQSRWMPRAFGLILQGMAALTFLGGLGANVSPLPFANAAFVGAMIIALSAFVLAHWLRQKLPHSGSSWARNYAEIETGLASPAYLFGFVFWCCAWLFEISRRVPSREQGYSPAAIFDGSTIQLLIMFALIASAALSMWLGLRARWAVATWPGRLTLAAVTIGFFAQADAGHRVLYTPAWMVWPAVLLLHYWCLYQFDRTNAPAAVAESAVKADAFGGYLHAGSIWLITLLLADCLWLGIDKGGLWRTSWAAVVLLISAIIALTFLTLWSGNAGKRSALAGRHWPLEPHAESYYWIGALPLALVVFGGAGFAAIHSAGLTAPLPYIPLLNPTDLTLALAVVALLFWRRCLLAAEPQPPSAHWLGGKDALIALALLSFVLINSVWLRVAHHFFGVRWNAADLFASFVVQTGYAILWTLLALGLMLLAHRRVQRPLWLTGAGLLGAVVVKLLLIDLSNAGGAERIIAFIAVGVLMLVVGYFAPLPPKPVALPNAASTKEMRS